MCLAQDQENKSFLHGRLRLTGEVSSIACQVDDKHVTATFIEECALSERVITDGVGQALGRGVALGRPCQRSYQCTDLGVKTCVATAVIHRLRRAISLRRFRTKNVTVQQSRLARRLVWRC